VDLGIDTRLTLLAAGLIFLLALALGVWKYHEMATSESHLAHPYVDIAHRAALLYWFATQLLAVRTSHRRIARRHASPDRG
jgi:HAMP domain-containing protein